MQMSCMRSVTAANILLQMSPGEADDVLTEMDGTNILLQMSEEVLTEIHEMKDDIDKATRREKYIRMAKASTGHMAPKAESNCNPNLDPDSGPCC